MQKGAETLGIEAKRTGGRVVDCSGLENLAGNRWKTAERPDICGFCLAPLASFTNRSAACVGAYVGTDGPLSFVPMVAEPRGNGCVFGNTIAGTDLVAFYHPNGEVCTVLNIATGKQDWPVKPKPERIEGRYDDSDVYFVQAATGQIKIGMTVDIVSRLQTMQTGCPVMLTLLATCGGGRPAEANYHRRFAEHRLHGEWFDPHPDIIAEVVRLQEGET